MYFQKTPVPAIEPVSINYCGENLSDLCVVSFSRDVFGNTIINLYVPAKKYPIFYLNIIRQSEASRFECEWEKKDRTSVHCTGKSINLGEGFKIQVISIEGDRLIAKGPFTLTAFLVTTQTAGGEIPASTAPEPDSKATTPTPTDSLDEGEPFLTDVPTEEPTETPEFTEIETPEITETDSP